MKQRIKKWNISFQRFLTRMGVGLRGKLIGIFLLVKVVPLILLTVIAWQQITILGDALRDMAVEDAANALNDSAIENIERMTTDTAQRVADFLYARDDDILFLASLDVEEEKYERFAQVSMGRLIDTDEWVLAEDGQSWVPASTGPEQERSGKGGLSTNTENNDMDGFNYRQPETFSYKTVPLYDEITFVDLDGMEQIKIVPEGSTKVNYPMSPQKRDVSRRENTYVKAETYFEQLQSLQPGEIYVSDVIGAYVGSNYIGMYTPDAVQAAGEDRGYDIEYDPEAQAYAGQENPVGQRFEGIVRWATPVAGEDGEKIGYVTFALNHDHIMEFVDHLTPMNERYTELPSAYEGNYAFIWDYQCRNICHPRHHSIVGVDPETGDAQVPWLESSIYDAWQQSGVDSWQTFVQQEDWPLFDGQSREKTPAAALTKAGLVGLDGRYLNNAPQCTGWMDLTVDGGSGSFYILWSGLYKLTTAGAIPYYTGQYAPSAENDYSYRGFGIVTIGAGLEDFTRPATDMEEKLGVAIAENLSDTSRKLIVTTAIIILLVVLIAIWVASSITANITRLIKGISRFRAGERQYRFKAPVKDEFGTLADSFDDMADSIVNSVSSPLSIIDNNQNIIYMNQQGLDFCEKELNEIVGTPYSESSIYPGGSEYDPILAMKEKREPDIFYTDKQDKYLRGKASYLYDKDGNQTGYIIESRDVTGMVREQQEREEQRTLLNEVFSASPDLIWYIDASGRYLTVNPRFADIVGLHPDEFVGKRARDILPDAIAATIGENDRRAIYRYERMYTEETLTFADGHEETLDAVRTPIWGPNGEPIGTLGFARNVTARVQMEKQLRNTQQKLETAVEEANRANQHKGEFLARMSHEIRTPMNAIIGLTNIVQKRLETTASLNDCKDEVEGHVNQIEASSQHLLGLLNDILDISKIEAGKIELTEEVIELPKLIETVSDIIRPRCEEKHITFNTRLDELGHTAFLGDSLRLRQVLINLLGNAVKFTPNNGTIDFAVLKKGEEDQKTLIEFSVQDTGIGISEEAQAQVFQAFEQGGSNVSRQYGGTGLGLAISRRIVELFGGQLQVNSKVGEGSCFYFSLWLRETDEAVAEESVISETADQFRNKRALLVDDVDINRMIVATMLEDTGITIDEEGDGAAALARFEASEVGTYDIILMDVQMPIMDGYEASAAIRELHRPDARSVPIVALTANAFKEDIDRALQHGMTAHIAKPVELDTLLEVLFKFLSSGL